MRKHLLVTNDFPPKVGGIQSYLWELWRRLDPEHTFVFTTPYAGAATFDKAQPMTVFRHSAKVLLPTRRVAAKIAELAQQVGAELVIYDPVLPIGAVAARVSQSVGLPYGLVLHGAEITVPARTPLVARWMAKALGSAELIISAGGYAAAEAQRCAKKQLPITEVSPGVDSNRFVPLELEAKASARSRFGLAADEPLVVGTSRLVPRKGFDQLIEAAGRLRNKGELSHLQLALAGTGRDLERLRRLGERHQVPVKFLGRVSEQDLPAVMGMGDVFAMPCRDRWGGLEQEGFGIVFLEAAAAGVCCVAGRSGGSSEAVEDNETGLLVGSEPAEIAAALARLLGDDALRLEMSAAARRRSVEQFDYEHLARRLEAALS